jgi:hypothetical protein
MNLSTDKIQGFDSEEDRKLLISLLSEYSEKLSILCDKLEASRARKSQIRLVLAILVSFAATIGFVAMSSTGIGKQQKEVVLSFVIALMNIIIVLMVMSNRWPSSFKFFIPINRGDERLARDIRLLSKKLGKVVQIVSQMQEHSPENVSTRIEMDFRLADAELVLERSISDLGLRQKARESYMQSI